MRWLFVVGIAIVCGGCDLIFKLRDPPADVPPDGPTVTCFPPDVGADPTLDSDGDGIFDVEDNCPTVSNTNQHDEDGDCRGDACDDCPHLAVDPDAGNTDGDGVGNFCDPREGTADVLYFESFFPLPTIADWDERTCMWMRANDQYRQQSPGSPHCFVRNTAQTPVAATIATVVILPQETIDSDLPFSVGFGYRLGNCELDCFGDLLTFSRDAMGSLFLRSATRNAAGVMNGPQRGITGPLDTEPIAIEIRFEDDGSATASVVYHGVRVQLDITNLAVGGDVALYTQGTTADFLHFTLIR